jgi:hypothetical protein
MSSKTSTNVRVAGTVERKPGVYTSVSSVTSFKGWTAPARLPSPPKKTGK